MELFKKVPEFLSWVSSSETPLKGVEGEPVCVSLSLALLNLMGEKAKLRVNSMVSIDENVPLQGLWRSLSGVGSGDYYQMSSYLFQGCHTLLRQKDSQTRLSDLTERQIRVLAALPVNDIEYTFEELSTPDKAASYLMQMISRGIDRMNRNSYLGKNGVQQLLHNTHKRIVDLAQEKLLSHNSWRDYCVPDIGENPIFKASKSHWEKNRDQYLVELAQWFFTAMQAKNQGTQPHVINEMITSYNKKLEAITLLINTQK